MKVRPNLLFFVFLIGFCLSFFQGNNAFAASATLSIEKPGTGIGTVLADGINCGSDCNETYTYYFFPSTKTVTYSLDPSSFFAGWSGACTGTGTCSVRMDADKTVSATFYKYNYTITAGAGDGGLINPGGTIASPLNVLVPYDASQPFSIIPSAGYHIDTVTVDGVSQGAISSYTFAAVKADHTITATFAINAFTITASKEGNGTISPTGATTVNYGGSQTYDISPTSPGYHVHDVLVDGVSQGAVTSHTFTNVTADHTISAIFQPDLFAITAQSGTTATLGSLDGCNNGTGGSINPTGVTSIPFGGAQTYTGSIASGYHLDQIYVDGVGVGTIDESGSYTFSSVNANHSITACFAINEYTITLNAGAGGTITGATSVTDGADNVPYTVTANTGYHIVNVSLDGTVVASAPSSPYIHTLNNVQSAHTISATFAIDTYAITVTQTVNGNISPSSTTVSYGGSQSFSITPATGYHIATVTVDDSPVVGAPSSYTFTDVQATHTLTATFAIDTYAITVTQSSNGTISPSSPTVNYNSSQAFTITPDSTYEIVDVLVDGSSVGAVSSYTFNNVTSTHTITASFSSTSYTITPTTGPNGTIDPSAPVEVGEGGSAVFTVTPDPNYYIADVVVDSVSVGAVAGYSFSNVTADHGIEASFSPGFVIQTSNSGSGTVTVNSPYTLDAQGRIILPVDGTGDPVLTFTGAGGTFVTDVLLDGVSLGAIPELALTDVGTNHSIEVSFGTGWTISVNPVTNGSITPATGEVAPDSTPDYTITPAGGYRVADILVDGISVKGAAVAHADNSYTYTFSAVTANHTLYATFLPGYVISATAGAHGSITPAGDVSVPAGGSQTFQLAADSGYKISEVKVDGVAQAIASSYTFSNVLTNHTLAVTFVADTYIITASASGNGTIDPSGSISVTYGDDQIFNFNPATGYHIAQIVVDNTALTITPLPDSYTFANVSAGHTLAVSFAPDMYTITASINTNGSPGGAGGTINPSGATAVSYGGSQTYTGSISTGYHLDHIEIDGEDIGTIAETGSYTFSNVGVSPDIGEHTIVAFFVTNTYTITASAGTGGTITDPGSSTVTDGASKSYTIAANAGYTINKITVDGSVVETGPASPYQYDFTSVSANHSVSATFSPVIYQLGVDHGANGTILPTGGIDKVVEVAHGSSQTFTMVEDTGYHVNEVTVSSVSGGSVSAGAVTTYTFTNITEDHDIYATFATGNIITASSGGNGSISPAGSVTVDQGTDQEFTFTPDTNYHVADVIVDGISQGPLASYTFTNVRERHSIYVTFDNKFTISISQEGAGTINPAGPEVQVVVGGNQQFTFSASTEGEAVTGVFVDGVLQGAEGSYTFSNVTADHSLLVTFGQPYTINAGTAPGQRGYIAPSGTIHLNPGDSQQFSIVADPGQAVADVLVDNISMGAIKSYTFSNVQSNHSIEATFTANSYIITASASTGGTIDPAGDTTVIGGDQQSFAVTSAADFAFGPVDGTCGGTLNTREGSFVSNRISQDCTVQATFVSDTVDDTHYTVTPSVLENTGGTISESTPQQVAEGGVISFLLTPAADYTLGPVRSTCGGHLDTENNIFTTFAVTRDCLVEASFVSDTGMHYELTSSAGDGGSIDPLGTQTLAAGEVVTFTLHPDAGYTLGPVEGTCGGSLDSQAKTFTTFALSRNCTVTASFVPAATRPHRITSSTGTGGTINLLGQQDVAAGEVVSFTLHPAPDYSIGPVGGTCGGNLNTQTNIFTTLAVTDDCTVEASFISTAAAVYTVSSSVANGGGEINPLGDGQVNAGGVLTYILHPDPGYSLGPVSGTCSGSLNTLTSTFTTLPVSQNCSVVASFVSTSVSYTVSASASTGGAIHLSGNHTVAQGGVVTFALLPDPGYTLGPVNGTCGGDLDTQANLFTTRPITQDCAVEATFVSTAGANYTIMATAGSGGNISPQGTLILHEGEVQTFALYPDEGYVLGPVGGSCGGSLNTQSKTFTTFAASQDCTLEATFVPLTGGNYTVTSSAGPGGSILYSGEQTVVAGAVISFTILPDSGFVIGPVNGTCTGTLNTQAKIFSTDRITADCTVEATFVAVEGPRYDVTTAVTGDGSIHPDYYLDVPENGMVSLTLHPGPDFFIGSVETDCNAEAYVSGSTFLVGPDQADCLVTANFVRNAHNLTFIKTGKGKDRGIVSSNPEKSFSKDGDSYVAEFSDSVELTATEKAGAKFVGWSGCDSVVDTKCTVQMDADREVTVEFYYFNWAMFVPASSGAGRKK
ncbi:MAG: hypothetical protein PHZ02_08175 [Desulfocapsaceae bacterium]|nr:hypothetical protein [Desulfocapsaceae bacterium]